ncbi:MAG: dihydropteroate synthase [Planctomycetes bacterium]|jgi:dihydropteroate synthase|nr:dihydropteroate synthase [Planctomycetota bacterium]
MAASISDILISRTSGQLIVMGVLNVTPDSFSDGGEFLAPADAVARARSMIAAGADIVDVGAESTRPGSRRVDAADQIDRLREILLPLCQTARTAGAHVSIDTTRAAVAEFALQAGAAIVNDVSAGRDDPAILGLAAEAGAPLVLMHMLGEPTTMQAKPTYNDVVADVRDFLAERLAAAEAAGVPRERCIVDPGIGFGKTLPHNLALMANLDQLATPPTPILLGPSRKRCIGEIVATATGGDAPPPQERLGGTLAACLAGRRAGATIVRVHDVGPLVQAMAVDSRIAAARRPDA